MLFPAYLEQNACRPCAPTMGRPLNMACPNNLKHCYAMPITAAYRLAAIPIALKTKAHMSPNIRPPKPSAKVSVQTPYQPTIAIPLIDIVFPPIKLKLPARKPSARPPAVHHFIMGQAARRQGPPLSISGMCLLLCKSLLNYIFSARP